MVNMTWEEWSRMQERAANNRPVELLSCPSCGCTWLYKVVVEQFSRRQVTLMQEPVSVHGGGFPFLVCLRCGKGVKPNTLSAGMTQEHRLYSRMINETMEKPQEPTPTTVEETPARENIPSKHVVQEDSDEVQADK